MNTQTQEALKMAIEALKNANDIILNEFSDNHDESLDAIQACKEALEQPAQEPVAWMDKQTFGLCEADLAGYGEAIPLYTHPAPSWQGLSDGEIDALPFYDYMTMEEAINLVRVIEAKLKEKNYG